jgi:hypothetical protein
MTPQYLKELEPANMPLFNNAIPLLTFPQEQLYPLKDPLLLSGISTYREELIDLLSADKKPDISDIFRIYGEDYRQKHKLSDHQIRVIMDLSIFSLRQALKLKFRRVLGVAAIYHKTTFAVPKLRHDFFFDFIVKNQDLFVFQTPHIKEIWKIYSWTNACIHLGILPRIWVLQHALDVVSPFFAPLPAEPNGRWHLHSSVKIYDLKELNERLAQYFHASYPETEWALELIEPEAVIIKKP